MKQVQFSCDLCSKEMPVEKVCLMKLQSEMSLGSRSEDGIMARPVHEFHFCDTCVVDLRKHISDTYKNNKEKINGR